MAAYSDLPQAIIYFIFIYIYIAQFLIYFVIFPWSQCLFNNMSQLQAINVQGIGRTRPWDLNKEFQHFLCVLFRPLNQVFVCFLSLSRPIKQTLIREKVIRQAQGILLLFLCVGFLGQLHLGYQFNSNVHGLLISWAQAYW